MDTTTIIIVIVSIATGASIVYLIAKKNKAIEEIQTQLKNN